MPSRNPEEEVKRLEDVIRRAAWLEWAADKKLETPYVPHPRDLRPPGPAAFGVLIGLARAAR